MNPITSTNGFELTARASISKTPSKLGIAITPTTLQKVREEDSPQETASFIECIETAIVALITILCDRCAAIGNWFRNLNKKTP
ncbi:MAG: hypothetical protein HY860_05380 [Chlamydiales bacterium]|nr:hypothetical protein [Chlamydiales bacterium]